MDKDEALKLALDALETTGAKSSDQWQKERKAITAIQKALAAPAVQEPWMYRRWDDEACKWELTDDSGWPSEPVYTTPPAQPAPVQEPITWLKTIETLGGFGKFVEAKPNEKGAKPVYLTPPAAPVQDLPFGVGGGLVAIKTLLSRDPCVHANTAIEMLDAILKEHPAAQRQWVGLSQDELDAMFSNTIKGKKLVNWVARAIEAKLKERNQ